MQGILSQIVSRRTGLKHSDTGCELAAAATFVWSVFRSREGEG